MSDLVRNHAEILPAGQADPFVLAMATFLSGYRPNTSRAYGAALHDFFQAAGRHPRDVTALDVAAWKVHLIARGLASSTVNARLSALSSYFSHLTRTPGPGGRPLASDNPVPHVGRRDVAVSPYGRARKLSPGDFRKILSQVPKDTPKGARDRALFFFYVLCARRRSEVVSLHGRDLRPDGELLFYRARLKGGAERWKELPPPVWEAIRHYLVLSGRTLTDEAPLFVATRGGEKPLSAQAAEDALRTYAARAGLSPEAVTLHSLRHLGAALFQEASADVRQTQMFLDHAHLNTTQVYLEALQGDPHRHWQAMLNRIGT